MSAIKIRIGDRPKGKKRRRLEKKEAAQKHLAMMRLIDREHQREKDKAMSSFIPSDSSGEEESGLQDK